MDAIVGHSLGSFAALYTLHRVEELPVKQLVITGTPGEVNEFFEFYQKMLGLSGRSVRAIRDAFMQNIQNYPEYFSAPKFAQSILIPGLIIHDKEDEETPYHHAKAIHRDLRIVA